MVVVLVMVVDDKVKERAFRCDTGKVVGVDNSQPGRDTASSNEGVDTNKAQTLCCIWTRIGRFVYALV